MIPNRHTDPLGYAKWWMGEALVAVTQKQADKYRLQLHSGMLPGLPAKNVLKRLKQLEQRAILIRSHARSGGHVIFVFAKQFHDLFMTEAEQRAQAQKGQ